MGIAAILVFLMTPIAHDSADFYLFPKRFPALPRRVPILMWPSVMNQAVVERMKKKYERYPLEGTEFNCSIGSTIMELSLDLTIDQIVDMVKKYLRNPVYIDYHRERYWHLGYVNRTEKTMWTKVLPYLASWLHIKVQVCGIVTFFPAERKVALQLIRKYEQQWIEILLGVLSLIFKTFVLIQFKNKDPWKDPLFLQVPFPDEVEEEYEPLFSRTQFVTLMGKKKRLDQKLQKWITIMEDWVDKITFQKSLIILEQLIRDSFDIVTAIIMDHLSVLATEKATKTEMFTMRVGNHGRMAKLDFWYIRENSTTLVKDMADNFFKCEVVNTCKCTTRPEMKKMKYKNNNLLVLSDPINCNFSCSAIPYKVLYEFAAMTTESALDVLCFWDRGPKIQKDWDKYQVYQVQLYCEPLSLIKARDDYMYNICGALNPSCVSEDCDCQYTIRFEKDLKNLKNLAFQELVTAEVLVV